MDLEIRTARLLLREVVADDASDIHAYASDPVCEYVTWGPDASLTETRAEMATWESERTAEPRTAWTPALDLDGTMIGKAAYPLLCKAIRWLARSCPSWHDGLCITDATPVPCGASRETAKRSDPAGHAGYGLCASHSRYYWGLEWG